MLKNYLKITWRSLTKNALYSVINIGGLAIGMAVSFMLLLYVYNEFSFDSFQKNNDRLYQVYRNQPGAGEIFTSTANPVQVAGVIKKDFPQVEHVARKNGPYTMLFNNADNGLRLNMMAADPALFDMMTFKFIKGSRNQAFAQLNTVVLTEKAAKKLFGNVNPLNKIVKIDNRTPVEVTAVVKDLPVTSTLQGDAFISWSLLENMQPYIKTSGWGNYSFGTYVLLRPGANLAAINKQMKGLVAKYDPDNKTNELFLYPFKKKHLYNEFKNGVNAGGRIEYVRLFLLLAIGILLIACINFMNLSTARSGKRAREVGVRKVVGASRLAVIRQFLGESLIMAYLAMIIAFIITIVALPYFNTLVSQQLSIPFDNVWMWVFLVLVTTITGLIAGSYPALYLSSFKPVKVLKGINAAGKTTLRPRQVLVIVQFSFATCLILCSILIYNQITYIKNMPIGYNKNGIVEMTPEGALNKQFESFRLDAIKAGAITDGALTSGSITNNGSSSWGIKWDGQVAGEDKIPIDQIVGTLHFTSTYGLRILEGRDFSADYPADSLSLLLNESAVKLMRFKHAIGQRVRWQGIYRTVVGVVKDFVWGSPYEPVKPAIIGYDKGWQGSIGLRLNPNKSVSQSLAILQRVYKSYNPNFPFEYTFVDEGFESKFETEKLLGTLSAGFTIFAILISCLGLFGLASFSAEQRRKEIGVRKVLGASISDLWLNLSKEFVILVVISFFIGAAISSYYMYGWLSKYTYHVSLNIWVFVFTIVISLGICLLTVSYQAIKAALANPVKSLRSE